MGMKSRAATSVVMFDVVYEDGTRNSNRKVLASVLDGFEGDEAARGVIEAQDRAIAENSGRARSNVKSIVRSPIKPPSNDLAPERKAKGGKR